MRSKHSNSTMLCALSLSATALLSAWPARAGEFKDFNIPPQQLETALLAFSEQSGAQVAISGHSIATLKTRGVSGHLTPRAALARLVETSDLEVLAKGEHSFALVASSDPQGSQDATPSSSAAPAGTEPQSTESAQPSPDSSETPEPKEKGERQNDAREPTATNNTALLETVIVTAQKREERLIDVPQSVTVLNAELLAKLNARQFRDFADMVPGLTFYSNGPGNTQINLRGIGTGFDVSPSVAVYVDDVPIGSSTSYAGSALRAFDAALFDVERIEVLRGPQGTLYGANTLGGLLKYVSKRPDVNTFGGELRTGVSTTHKASGVGYNVAAAINIPIVEKSFALRASAFQSHDSGFVDSVLQGRRDVNRSDIYGGKLDLLFSPTDRLNIRLTGLAQNTDADGVTSVDYAFGTAQPAAGDLTQVRRISEPLTQRLRLASGTLEYSFEAVDLTTISAYQTISTPLTVDITGNFAPLLRTLFGRNYSAVGNVQLGESKRFTQEMRLASAESDGPIEWIVGGFYVRETSLIGSELRLLDAMGQPAPNDVAVLRNPSHYVETAGFGNLTWNFGRQFDATLGIRYTSYETDFTQTGTGLFGVNRPTVSGSDSNVTYLANARYRPSDNATLYARYATGYRPGGPNFVQFDPITGEPLAPPTFEADSLKSYEVGLKRESASGRYSVDVSVFHVDWDDIQIFGTRSGLGVRLNALGGATIWGSELAFTLRPNERLVTTAGLSFLDPTMSEADADLRAAKGERLPWAPRFTGTLSADYDIPFAVARDSRPTVGATVRYVGERTAGFDNSVTLPQYRLPAYTLVDIRSGLHIGSVAAQVYVSNIFDERAEYSATIRGPIVEVGLSQPRTVGISLNVQF